MWASLPPELLHDIIRKVEESDTAWPAPAAVVSCASVSKSWRGIPMETVKIPEQCGLEQWEKVQLLLFSKISYELEDIQLNLKSVVIPPIPVGDLLAGPGAGVYPLRGGFGNGSMLVGSLLLPSIW
ncbi:unnamed protein product [Microthlaspi erraticum]|uniref:F-box domain-containing protein n=1 Tax=Microthlaspi erraticum TaxID=1685480 RepID=A0A6D2KZF8_9BRAS|nr:unnamed protein product [Microthlaspi erraticum]